MYLLRGNGFWEGTWGKRSLMVKSWELLVSITFLCSLTLSTNFYWASAMWQSLGWIQVWIRHGPYLNYGTNLGITWTAAKRNRLIALNSLAWNMGKWRCPWSFLWLHKLAVGLFLGTHSNSNWNIPWWL